MKAAVTAVLILTVATRIADATTSTTRTASYECLENEVNYTMYFAVERHQDPDLNYTQAWNETDHFVPGCASHPVEDSPFTITGDNDLFEITINIRKQGLFVDTSCGQTSDGLVFTWRFFTSKALGGIVQSKDTLFVATCNFSDPSPLTVNNGRINVQGTPLEGHDATNPDAALNLVDENDNVLTTVALGDIVKLRVTQIQGPPAIITAFGCFAGPDSVFDEGPSELELLQYDGCVAQYGGQDFVSAPFTGGSPSAFSGTFKQFRFVSSDYVHYRCFVRYCFDSDNSCDNLCLFNGRKKRQADETKDLVVQAGVRVMGASQAQTPEAPTTERDPAAQSATCTEVYTESCLDNVGVIAAFSVLGVLLLVTITAAVVLYFRAIKLSRWAQKQRL